MKKYCRTDLACEAADDLAHVAGTEYRIEDKEICIIEKLDVISKDAARVLEKKTGRYITVSMPRLQYLDDAEVEELADIISCEISSIICRAVKKNAFYPELSVMVVGLGNSKITADAIGPETVDRITVTRHIKERDLNIFNALKTCTISALSPNVLGKTGIESSDIIKAAVQSTRPDIVIVLDALAARSVERLARTVQISDTGITPGAGIGNHRSEISLQTLNVPVIAIGIPTVVDSAVLAFETLNNAGISPIPQAIIDKLDSIDNFFVTLKETDVIIEKSASLLSKALMKAFVISE